MTARSSFASRTVAVVVTVGVAAALAGCGNESRAGYADPNSGGVTYAAKALSKDQIMGAAYDAAMKAGSAHMTMKMSGKAKLSARGDIVYAAHKPSMAMSMAMPQLTKGRVEMRMVAGKVYMQLPGITPPGKYFAIDPKDRSSALAKSFAGTTNQLDPLKSLQLTRKAIKSAERVGKQGSGSTEVDHYKVVVDTKALTRQLAPSAPAGPVPDDLTYDLWLDGKHLLRRVAFEISGVSFEAEMSRWGKPVKVQAPAPSQLVALPGSGTVGS
jgi:lipoprotein LprG